jgi:hypothetical protein
MARSKEMRGILGEEMAGREPAKAAKHPIEMAERYGEPAEVAKLQERYEALADRLEELEAERDSLAEGSVDMDDAEFDRRAAALEENTKRVINEIRRGESKESEIEWAGVVSWEKIQGLDDFAEHKPMYWVPTKEEVGRILETAMSIHERRVQAGAVQPDEPISILDVGGANGALGKLVVDLAKENGLEVRYQVTDPLTEAVEKAAEQYRDESGLGFHDLTGGELASQELGDDPEIGPLAKARQEAIEQGRRAYDDLLRLKKVIIRKQGGMTQADAERIAGILKQDFKLDIDPATLLDEQACDDLLEGGWDSENDEELKPLARRAMKPFSAAAREATKALETAIGQRPASRDLVINSWMPPDMDFTGDIRVSGGGAIMYLTERGGATGMHNVEDYDDGLADIPGAENSYQPGPNYEEAAQWRSESLADAAMTSRVVSGQSGYSQEEWHYSPKSNVARIQVRHDLASETPVLGRGTAKLKLGEPYPWEKELEAADRLPTAVEEY